VSRLRCRLYLSLTHGLICLWARGSRALAWSQVGSRRGRVGVLDCVADCNSLSMRWLCLGGGTNTWPMGGCGLWRGEEVSRVGGPARVRWVFVWSFVVIGLMRYYN